MQYHKIEANSELIYEDGSSWSTLIFIKIIGSDTLWFPLPPSEVLLPTILKAILNREGGYSLDTLYIWQVLCNI